MSPKKSKGEGHRLSAKEPSKDSGGKDNISLPSDPSNQFSSTAPNAHSRKESGEEDEVELRSFCNVQPS